MFNLLASTYASSPLAQFYRQIRKENNYDERIHEVKRGTFSSLLFSSFGGMGSSATVVYKRIATLIAEKRGHPYCHVLYWFRCHLCFSLLCSAVMCLQGSRLFLFLSRLPVWHWRACTKGKACTRCLPIAKGT